MAQAAVAVAAAAYSAYAEKKNEKKLEKKEKEAQAIMDAEKKAALEQKANAAKGMLTKTAGKFGYGGTNKTGGLGQVAPGNLQQATVLGA